METDVLIKVHSSVVVKNLKLKNPVKKTNSTTHIYGLPITPISSNEIILIEYCLNIKLGSTKIE